MPELDIQPRREPAIPWWVWLIGALIAALLIRWIITAASPRRDVAQVAPNERVAGERQETGTPSPSAALAEGALPVRVIQQDWERYHGQTVSGTATVTEVVSNRGFWVEQNGNRLFVIDGRTTPSASELRPGQQVYLSGWIYRSGETGRMPQVKPMDEQTTRTLAEQRVFMHVTEVRTVGDQTPHR